MLAMEITLTQEQYHAVQEVLLAAGRKDLALEIQRQAVAQYDDAK